MIVEVARPPKARPRYPEFDALRGTAILLVVTLHSALAYTRLDIPRLLWGVRERSDHPGFDLFCWWAMGVSVPLFFAISGFFAALVMEARGPSAFLRGRARRIVVPMLMAVPTILPLCFFAWCLGWLTMGRCSLREVWRVRFLEPGVDPEVYGPAHLWFLEYLIPMLGAFWASWELEPARSPGPRPDGRWLAAWWAPLALAVPTTLLMAIGRAVNGVDLALDRHNSFLIDPIRLLHFAAFFAFGFGAHRVRGLLLDGLAARAPWYLAGSLAAFGVRAVLLPLDWAGEIGWPGAWALAASGALASWLSVFGLIGLYRRHLGRPSPVARYLAESSFWLYLVHLPIVGLIQADLYPLPVPTAAKFAATWALTMALGLASYGVLVRGSALGRLLNGGVGKGAEAGPHSRAALKAGRPDLRRGRPARPRR